MLIILFIADNLCTRSRCLKFIRHIKNIILC